MSAPPPSLTDAPSRRAGGGRGSNLARRAGVLLVTGRRPYASRTQALEPLQSPGTHSRSPGRGTFMQEEETWSSGRDTQTPHYGRRQHSPPWDLIGRDNPSLTLTPSGVSRGGGRPWGPAASVVSHGGLVAPADPRRQRGEPQGRGRRGGGLLSHCLSPGISSAFVWGTPAVGAAASACSPRSAPQSPSSSFRPPWPSVSASP